MRPGRQIAGRQLIVPVKTLALAVGAAAALATSAPGALADSGDWTTLNPGSEWVNVSSTPLFDTTHIAPGWRASRGIELRSNSSAPGALVLGATDIAAAASGHEMVVSAYLDSDVAGHSAVGLRIDATLPITSGTGTQTDQVAFSFRISPEGSGSPRSVLLGTKHTRHSSGILSRLADRLPFTGSPAERFVAAALWLVIGGTGLALLARSRRGRSRA